MYHNVFEIHVSILHYSPFEDSLDAIISSPNSPWRTVSTSLFASSVNSWMAAAISPDFQSKEALSSHILSCFTPVFIQWLKEVEIQSQIIQYSVMETDIHYMEDRYILIQ